MAVTVETLELNIQATGVASAVSALQSLRASVAGVGGSLSASTTGRMAALGVASAKSSKGVGLLSGSLGKLLKFAFVFRIVSNAISGAITESNKYVENLNLFTVAMGEYADSALAYANTVQEALGINAGDWIRYQGVFNLLFTGFGTTTEMAAQMSQQLTQLGYDISSLYNVEVDIAMKKLQSAITGQTKSVREYGYDVSNVTIQEIAQARGIDEKVASMTMAEKAALRYIALMEQNSATQGDLSRTISSSANQLRILKAQLELAARAIGNIFVPALMAVLPYVIAFLQVIRMLADMLASLFGFELPSFDYSGISAGAGATDDLGDSLDRASGSAKKLKGSLASFDELNVIPQTQSGGGGGGGGGGGLGSDWLSDLELPMYDFLQNVQDKINVIKDNLIEMGIKFYNALKPLLDPAWQFTKDVFAIIINSIKNIIESGALALFVEGFVEFISGVTSFDFDRASSGFQKMADGIVLALSGVWEAVRLTWEKDAVEIELFLNEIIEGVNFVIRGVNALGGNIIEITPIEIKLSGAYLAEESKSVLSASLAGAVSSAISSAGELYMPTPWEEFFNDDYKQTLREDAASYVIGIETEIMSGVIDSIISEHAAGVKKYGEGYRKSLSKWLSDSATSASKSRETIEAARLLGRVIPDEARNTFNDYQYGKAISGDYSAELYVAGVEASKSSGYMSFLSVVEGMGKRMEENFALGIANNVHLAYDATTGALTSVSNGITTTFPTITMTLAQNFAAMGIDLRNYVGNLPADINAYLQEQFGKQGWLYNIDARLGISIITTITESVVYKQLATKYGQSLADSMTQQVISTANLGRIDKIAQYASGGFPQSGQYFMARENGSPEIVGTMGGHTAVANNDQIVEGIKSGVAEAQSEQNALLREQNDLLREIASKEGMEPSAAWGAFVAKSNAMYAKAGG